MLFSPNGRSYNINCPVYNIYKSVYGGSKEALEKKLRDVVDRDDDKEVDRVLQRHFVNLMNSGKFKNKNPNYDEYNKMVKRVKLIVHPDKNRGCERLATITFRVLNSTFY